MTTTLIMCVATCRATNLSTYSVVPLPPHRLSKAKDETEAVAVVMEEMLALSPSTLRRRHRP